MESFMQALGGVEMNGGSFLHLENFCKKFPGWWSWEHHDVGLQRRGIEIISLGNVATWK